MDIVVTVRLQRLDYTNPTDVELDERSYSKAARLTKTWAAFTAPCGTLIWAHRMCQCVFFLDEIYFIEMLLTRSSLEGQAKSGIGFPKAKAELFLPYEIR